MRKFAGVVATLSLLASLCGASPAIAAAPALCIAYDTGGPGDRSFNDAVFAGVKKSQQVSALSVESVVTDGTSADRDKRVRGLVSKGCSVIVAVGSGYFPTLRPIATEFPDQQFSIINDQSIASFNVASIVFDAVQGAFLAGVAAALSTKSGKVGMITTPGQSSVYDVGFVAGVKATKKNVKPFVRLVSTNSALSARALMNSGVDIIYIATSGSADVVFDAVVNQNTSKQRKPNSPDVGVIILEPDLYLTVTSSTAKYLLATVVKRVDKAVMELAMSALSDTPILELLDEKNEIYGHRYNIADQGIQLVAKSKGLVAQISAINAIASAAYER